MAAQGSEVVLFGADNGYNNPQQLNKMRTTVIQSLTPLYAQICQISEDTAFQQLNFNFPQVPATTKTMVTSLVRTRLQQYVTAMAVDNKNIFVAGVGYITVYNVEKLKTQILYDFYCRVGDMLAKIQLECDEE